MVHLNSKLNQPEDVGVWYNNRKHNNPTRPNIFLNTLIMRKKEYPIMKVSPNGKSNWGEGARTWCFVYSKNHGNFILEGYRGEVEAFLKKNYTHYFCYYSMWRNGRSRGYWKFWKDASVQIYEPSKISKKWKYRVIKYKPSDGYGYRISTKKEERVLEFKRLPKRWISDFNEL